MEHAATRETVQHWNMVRPGSRGPGSLDAVQRLFDVDAVAIKLQKHIHQAITAAQPGDVILVPADEAEQRLISARMITIKLESKVRIFACTEARRAVAVTNDRDRRDHKYLSGLMSGGNSPAYCGGFNAAIERALLYAPYADVVCFKSTAPDLSEARQFAEAVKAVFPERQLAFDYSPRPDDLMWNELAHASFESQLRRLGYSYYFFTQFGTSVFPHFPADASWVMFDDAFRERRTVASL